MDFYNKFPKEKRRKFFGIALAVAVVISFCFIPGFLILAIIAMGIGFYLNR